MQFWTIEEARLWLPATTFGPQPFDDGSGRRPNHLRADFGVLPSSRIPAVLTTAIASVGSCTWWLLWMDVGPAQWAGGNTHLYYRLRQSYQDYRLLQEAPCHLIYQNEWPDLLTLVQVGVLNHWDIHLVTDLDQGRLFVSHDEWLSVSTRDDLTPLREALAGAVPARLDADGHSS